MSKNPIFEANPSLDCYFETTDGNAFFTENAAETHAKTLKDKKVAFVHKSSTITETEQVKELEVVAEVVAPTEAKLNTKK